MIMILIKLKKKYFAYDGRNKTSLFGFVPFRVFLDTSEIFLKAKQS